MPAGTLASKRLAGRKGDANRTAVRRGRERHGDGHGDVLAARGLGSGAGPRSAGGAEQLRQNVGVDPAAFCGEPAAAEVEAETACAAARLPAEAEPLELGRARFALGVDLAAVERPALLFVAENFVSRADLGEALLRLRFLALVGVILFCEFSESGLDVGRAGPLRYPKNVIWIAHHEPILRRPPSRSAAARVSQAYLGPCARPCKAGAPASRLVAESQPAFAQNLPRPGGCRPRPPHRLPLAEFATAWARVSDQTHKEQDRVERLRIR